jgi:hypothetical protein
MEYNHIDIDLYPHGYEIDLAGFSTRDDSNQQYGINEVKLKLLWIKLFDSHLIFVSLDTLYFPESLSEFLYDYFESHYDITSDCIICNATHTHSAPNLALEKFGKISSEYQEYIISEIKQNLITLGSSFKSCELFLKSIKNPNKNIIGRRKIVRDVFSGFIKKHALLLPNAHAPIDNDLRLLVLKDHAGKIKALIYNFSCHPVFATSQATSSDFPGLINQQLASSDIPFSMYLQGFCGDIRPNIATSAKNRLSFKGRVKSLMYGAVFSETTPEDLNLFASEMAGLILSNLDDEKHKISEYKQNSFMYEISSETGNVSQSIVVKLFSFNRVIGVSIPAEVLSSYYLHLRNNFPDTIVIPMGFSEGMIGYLPMYHQLSEGGYEVGSSKNYGWDSPFDSDNLQQFLEVLVYQVDQMLKEIKS